MKKDPRFQPVDAAVTPRFAGIATFMPRSAMISRPISISRSLAFPSTSASITAGARQGPAACARPRGLIRRVHSTSALRPMISATLRMSGDAPVNPIDLARSIDMIEAFFSRIHTAGRRAAVDRRRPYRATAHPSGPGKGSPVGIFPHRQPCRHARHACRHAHQPCHDFRRGVEEGLIDPKRTIQIGLRGSRFSPDDINGARTLDSPASPSMTTKQWAGMPSSRRSSRCLGKGPTYMTIDIDDGSIPPGRRGTGFPEIRRPHAPGRAGHGCGRFRGCSSLAAISARWPLFRPTGITAVTAANLMLGNALRAGGFQGPPGLIAGRATAARSASNLSIGPFAMDDKPQKTDRYRETVSCPGPTSR